MKLRRCVRTSCECTDTGPAGTYLDDDLRRAGQFSSDSSDLSAHGYQITSGTSCWSWTHHVEKISPAEALGEVWIKAVTHDVVCVAEVAVGYEQQRLTLCIMRKPLIAKGSARISLMIKQHTQHICMLDNQELASR